MTSASAGGISADELFQLATSIDNRFAANANWLMRFSTYQAVLQIKSTGNNYVFPAERDAAGYPLLMGRRIYISPSVPALGANARAVLFGDLSRLRIRTIGENSYSVQALVERYAEFGAIGYMLFARMDAQVLKGSDFGSPVVSSSPIKFILQHS